MTIPIKRIIGIAVGLLLWGFFLNQNQSVFTTMIATVESVDSRNSTLIVTNVV